jgi:hypothetical protein
MTVIVTQHVITVTPSSTTVIVNVTHVATPVVLSVGPQGAQGIQGEHGHDGTPVIPDNIDLGNFV